MTRQRKVLPARKQGDRSRKNESLLIRSAESLGRMIGSLQRQLEGATRAAARTRSEGARKRAAVTSSGTRTQARARKGASKATKKR